MLRNPHSVKASFPVDRTSQRKPTLPTGGETWHMRNHSYRHAPSQSGLNPKYRSGQFLRERRMFFIGFLKSYSITIRR